MSEFKPFGDAVRRRFEEMSKHELYEVDATDLWESYLNAFPEGSNPIFRERTEHDCSCCKNFVRNVGHVIALADDGQYNTVWGGWEALPEPYKTVGQRMSDIVRQLPIKGVFRTKQPSYGAPVTHEHSSLAGSGIITWNHFSAKIDRRHLSSNPEEVAGKLNTGAQVMLRQLRELSLEAVNTVDALINEGQLYRGEEHKASVQRFAMLKLGFDALPDERSRVAYAWRHAQSNGTAFRNSVIGGLVTALSDGEDLEVAVRKFEAQVAPQNYKRPKAIVTQKMLDDALEAVRGLDLESSLERRHARLPDVSVTDVLWVDGSVRPAMKGGMEGLLAGSVSVGRVSKNSDRQLTIDEFVQNIVPKATSIGVVLEPRNERNLVSLTAPVDPQARLLFRWPGDLGWSYKGDVTDSVRERVKRAGGNVDAPLRVSLSWSNTDDLDLHCMGPQGHVYYGNPWGGRLASGDRILDVDMNNGYNGPLVRDAVENLSWSRMVDGVYSIVVHQFRRRERADVGFSLEFHHPDGTQNFTYSQEVFAEVPCFTFEVLGGRVKNITLGQVVDGLTRQTEFWGVKTGVVVPVDTLMLSPNHASGEGSGARHWFFILSDCINPDPVRGIYNEFLRTELLDHKRVFELLGSKSKAPFSPDQMSGVGFTKGREDSVRVQVTGEGVGGQFVVTF